MTTGEKLSKLRKENGYTQEALAEILGVSRQSISKWESDGSFPETDKLIQLSRLYKCSIDYLLKPEVEDGKVFLVKETKGENSLKKYLTKNLFTSIWSGSVFILTLLFYLFPYVRAEIFVGAYLDANIYNLLGSANYQFGNLLVLIALILQIAMLLCGTLIYIKNDKRLFLTRQLFSYFEAFIWILSMILFIDHFLIGQLFMIILSVSNAVGLTIIDQNRYFNEDGSKYKIDNCIFTSLWSVLIYILNFIIYLNPYVSINSRQHNLFSFITNTFNIVSILTIIVVVCDLLILIFGVIISFKKHLYKQRLVISYVSGIIYLIIMILVLGNMFANIEIYLNFGMIFLLVMAIINVIGLSLIKFNKSKGEVYEG